MPNPNDWTGLVAPGGSPQPPYLGVLDNAAIAGAALLGAGDIRSIAGWGDSRVAQFYADYPNKFTKNAYNPFAFGLALSGQRARMAFMAAESGLRPDEFATEEKFSACLASGAHWLLMSGPLNGINYAPKVNEDFFNLYYLPYIRRWLGAGRRIILMTEPGANALQGNSDALKAKNKFNSQVREFCKLNPGGALLFEYALLILDQSAAMTLNATMSGDGTHANLMTGGLAIGQRFAELISSVIPPLDTLVRSSDEIFANGAFQWNPDPMFATNSGGSDANGLLTGVIPQGITSTQGPATAVGSMVTGADGRRAWRVVITASGAGEYLIRKTLTSVGTENPGDVFWGNAKITLISGHSNFQSAGVAYSNVRGGTTYLVRDMFAAGANGNMPAGSYSWVSETERLTVRSGARGAVLSEIRVYFSAAGSATLEFQQWGAHAILNS